MTCAFIYQFGSGTYVVGPKLSPLEATEEATNLPLSFLLLHRTMSGSSFAVGPSVHVSAHTLCLRSHTATENIPLLAALFNLRTH